MITFVTMIAANQFGAIAVDSDSIYTSLIVILLAYLSIGAVMLLSADIWTEHGLSFAVYLRAPFEKAITRVATTGRLPLCGFEENPELGGCYFTI